MLTKASFSILGNGSRSKTLRPCNRSIIEYRDATFLQPIANYIVKNWYMLMESIAPQPAAGESSGDGCKSRR